MIADSAQVATVISPRLGPIVRAGSVGWLVVGWIAIRETVRHDQVHHVARSQPLKAADRRLASRQRELELRCTVVCREAAHESARAGVGSNLQPHEKVLTSAARLR